MVAGPFSRHFAERVLNRGGGEFRDRSARRPEGDPVQRGGSAPEQPFDSDRKAKSQHRHARRAIGGQCKCTAPCRARGLAQRGEAQGGRGGCGTAHTTRHVFLHFFFLPPSSIFTFLLTANSSSGLVGGKRNRSSEGGREGLAADVEVPDEEDEDKGGKKKAH
jgi:hypothetical protein